MKSPDRWSMTLPTAAMAALLSVCGCGTIHRWEQEHDQATVRREQVAGSNLKDSSGDRDRKRKEAQHEARLKAAQAALALHQDGDSLAASALFEHVISGSSNDAALGLAARAAATAPTRPDLAFIQLQLCESVPGCDAAPQEVHLRQLDPHNGVTWMYALLHAQELKNEQDWIRALEALAQSERIDQYWNRIASHLTSAAVLRGGLDAGSASVDLIGAEATFSVPLESVGSVCMVDRVMEPRRLDLCRRIATSFRHGDTSLVEAYGTSLALRLWPDGSPEKLQIAAERRVLRYRVDLMSRNAAKVSSPQASQTLATLIPKYPSEQTAMRALFIHLGLTPDPPDNWQEQAQASAPAPTPARGK